MLGGCVAALCACHPVDYHQTDLAVLRKTDEAIVNLCKAAFPGVNNVKTVSDKEADAFLQCVSMLMDKVHTASSALYIPGRVLSLWPISSNRFVTNCSNGKDKNSFYRHNRTFGIW